MEGLSSSMRNSKTRQPLVGFDRARAIDNAACGRVHGDHLKALFQCHDVNGQFGRQVFERCPVELEL